MKKYLCLLLSLLMLGLAACGNSAELPTLIDDDTPSSAPTDTSVSDIPASSEESGSEESSSAPSSSNTSSTDKEVKPISKDDGKWNMVLVNPWEPLPEGFNPQLASINVQYASYSSAKFDARAIDWLHAMCKAAAKDGVKLVVISAYRTNATQQSLFNNKAQRVKNADPSLTHDQAVEEAAKVVAKPGTSEHQLGLAVDFNSVEDSFRYTKQYKWLQEHCTDYGFILRYADDKQDKTGIIPEPWHYRYVGVEMAKKIAASGLSMEEYLENNGE